MLVFHCYYCRWLLASAIIDEHAMTRCSRLVHPLCSSMAAGYFFVCVCVGVSCEGITSDCRILCLREALCSNAHVIMCAVSFFFVVVFCCAFDSCAAVVTVYTTSGVAWMQCSRTYFIYRKFYVYDLVPVFRKWRRRGKQNERTNERTEKKLVGTSLHFARLAEVNAHKIYKRFNIFIFTLAHCTMPWHRERACGIQQHLFGWVPRRRLRSVHRHLHQCDEQQQQNEVSNIDQVIWFWQEKTKQPAIREKENFVTFVLVREKSISRRRYPGVAASSVWQRRRASIKCFHFFLFRFRFASSLIHCESKPNQIARELKCRQRIAVLFKFASFDIVFGE